MKRLVYLLSLSGIVSLSCNLVSGLFSGPALVEATGPILGMVVAASLDDQGQPVDASFTYPTDQPEMVVLVRIGEVTPGPLTFSWYRVTDAGDEALFEQTVTVEARDAAFSTGLNPGILAAATYKVVATFAGGSETIAWDVAEPQTGDLTALMDTSGSAAGGTPTPGPSGTTPVVVREPGSQDVSGPIVGVSIYSMAPQVRFVVASLWTAASISFTVQVSPAITGSAGASRQYTHPAGSDQEDNFYHLNPCTLPDGSDLPGTSITVTVVPLGYERNRISVTYVLEQDTSLPFADVDPSVQPGQKVNPGDQIVLKVTGQEWRTGGGSWQTGIWQMQVTGPAGLVGEAWTNPSRLPLPCDSKTWSSPEKTFTYTVPPNPPATIELCVLVEDYNDNFNQRDCGTYYTGSQLEGKLTYTSTRSGPNDTSVKQVEADLSLHLEPGHPHRNGAGERPLLPGRHPRQWLSHLRADRSNAAYPTGQRRMD